MPLRELDRPERILMEWLIMGDIALSPDVLERNWDIDPGRSHEVFQSLEAKGFVEDLGNGVYAPTSRAFGPVLTRGPARA